MNRVQKQNVIAVKSRLLAASLESGQRPFFGNQGVSVYRDGHAGDVVGHVLELAGVLPRVTFDETDPKAAVALALGVTKADLPTSLQVAINTLAITADDTKRSYARRVPKLVKLLNAFAEEIQSASIVGVKPVTSRQTQTRIVIPGKAV